MATGKPDMTLAEAINQARSLQDEPDSPSRRERADRLLRFFCIDTAAAPDPGARARYIVSSLADPVVEYLL